MSDNNPKQYTIEEVVQTLENQAELISFPVPKYGEQHISLKMHPTALNTPLFGAGVDPIHELYNGVPDFRKELSDRMAATYNACKGIRTCALNACVVKDMAKTVEAMLDTLTQFSNAIDWGKTSLPSDVIMKMNQVPNQARAILAQIRGE